MNKLSPTDWYFISLTMIVFGSLCIGGMMGYVIGELIGYRRGIEHVTESVLEAEFIGECEEVEV